MWALLLLIVTHDYRTTPTVTAIPGFQTEAGCRQAAKNAVDAFNATDHVGYQSAAATCLYQGSIK